MPKSTSVPQSEAANEEPEGSPTSHRQERIAYLTSRVEELENAGDSPKEVEELTAEVDRLDSLTDEQFEEELDEELDEPEDETFSENEEGTGGEIELETTTSSPTGAPTLTDAAGTPAPAPNEVDPETGKPLSAYKKRLRELKRDALGAEIPLELADMMRTAAKKAGDIAVTAWIRLAWADAVNNANLTHTVDNAEVPWTFDKKNLEITLARSSTRGLSTEEKEKKEAEKKAAAVDQRSLVKFLLVEHKVKTGVPLNGAEVEVLKANNREDLLTQAKVIG